ncbi:MAG: site-specific DNA-methyltransferase [Solirubrobacteraceae bacterium]
MAKLDDLIAEVADVRLRSELQAAAEDLKGRRTFGLVFEEHIPELTLLRDFPIKPGATVYLRTDTSRKSPMFVEKLVGKSAAVLTHDGKPKRVPIDQLVVLKRFGDPVYPTLRPVGVVERGKDKPYHAVIDAENFHALQLLKFTCEHQVDCIYIDPPYNTGARDWTYNNDFVDRNDRWRHSKWLSMMDKRLRLARDLLAPDGVLIVTIDEHEVHHLGMLLEDVFPTRNRQMVTIVINPKGVTQGGLSRVEEYAIFCYPEGRIFEVRGDDLLSAGKGNANGEGNSGTPSRVRWQGLLHSGDGARREDRPNMFYPVLIDPERRAVVGAGEPLLPVDRNGKRIWPKPDLDALVDGHVAVWPIRSDKSWGRWYLGHNTLREYAAKGYVSLGGHDAKRKTWALSYPYRSIQQQVASGAIQITGYDETRNVVDMRYVNTPTRRLKTVWHRSRHDAGAYGADLLGDFLGARLFPFPKSLYSVRDTLAAVVGQKRDALILDFFAGSGTTLHATALLNAEDGGRRRCVLVTNNEVEDTLAKKLNKQKLFSGDAEYDKHGIFEAVCRPRCEAALTGRRADGRSVDGKYLDGGGAYSDGFHENCVFMRVDYLDPDEVELGRKFAAILPTLWLASGAAGPQPSGRPTNGYLLPKKSPFGVLLRESALRRFMSALDERSDVTHVWLVCDSERAFADMRAALSGDYIVSMLYRDYLRHFAINTPIAS